MNGLARFFQGEYPEKDLDTDKMLVVEHLTKRYGDFTAVNDISFSVKKGSLFAFLGQNGAGKSTTINIICSILGKNDGDIYVDGYSIDKHNYLVKSMIGIVFQNSVLDRELSARENLTLRAAFYGVKGKAWTDRLNQLASMLELFSFIDKPVSKLSGGQKRRVDIARAMVHNPKLLILDEPTTGLDPQTRISVWNLINSLREKTGMTVFLTTHYMEEAEKATYVVIMDKGVIKTRGTPTELKNQFADDYIYAYMKESEELEEILNKEKRTYHYNKDSKFYAILVSSTSDAIDFLDSHREYIKDFEVKKGDMDDVFLNVTEQFEMENKDD